MKEYIEKQSLIKFFDNIRQPKMPITEGFKFITVDSIIEYLSKQPHADVVERAEYERLLKENERLRGDLEFKSEAINSICQIHKEYVSKIDRAIEEINDAPVLFVDFPLGKHQVLRKDVVLDILKRNIGE